MLGAIAFGVQIYCDFSGYSDIAIGAAAILGFNIPANFNKPFFATSPSEFWNRWHISLSTWVRDYVFYPLVMRPKKSTLRLVSSILVTFFLIGIWHGAGWNFIIFGIMHGLYVGFQFWIKSIFPSLRNNTFLNSRSGRIISILITQYFVFLAFLAFRVHDFDDLSYVLYKYVIWDFAITKTLQILSHNQIPVMLIIGFFILHFISYKKNIVKSLSEIKIVYWIITLFGIMTLILFFYDLTPEEFIYFRF